VDSGRVLDDGLAKAVSFDARYGAGVERVLVLGGGGIVFVAWLLGYLRGLADHGVALESADRVVGTSAGSVVAAVITAGHLTRAHREIEALAKAPGVVAALAPAGDLHPSQQRALELFWSADNARPETIRAIGHAALAAHTPGADTLPRSLELVLGQRHWSSEALWITATDAFTGERIVLTREAGVPVHDAAAASSTVPGLFAPQPIGDRKCIDGGVSGSAMHPDLAAGAARALVIAVRDPGELGVATNVPGGFARSIDALRATGTAVEVRTSRLAAGDINLMDPHQIAPALVLGAEQSKEDAQDLVAFFGS
jgi:NTE family protein